MNPVISEEDFISPKDKLGEDLFYRVSTLEEIARIPKMTTVYFVDKIPYRLMEHDKLLNIMRERMLTVYKLDRPPLHLYTSMCYSDRVKYQKCMEFSD